MRLIQITLKIGTKSKQDLKCNTYRSIKATLKDLETGNMWSANSIKELSKICPIAYPTLIRMKKQDLRCKLYNKYKLIINEK